MATTTTTPVRTRVFGSGIRRREDPRLLTGTARYTADITLPGQLHAAILRSPHGHARIKTINTSAAEAAPGVVAAFTGADTEGVLQSIPCAWLVPNSDLKVSPYPPIARDVVRYVGDAVAVVVAESAQQAYDAVDLIEVDYQPLPATVDPEQAVKATAPQLHSEAPNNIAFHWTVAGGDIDRAFKGAEVVVRDRIVQQRLIPTAMETRGALAHYLPATGELTLWNTTQNPHIVRFIMSLVSGIPEDRLRVIAPEVGGGFGSKIAQIQGDFITVFCSMKLGRPVKWIESRSENYQSTTHGRDHVQDVELAATKDGRILGLRCTVWAGMGAYLSTAAPGIPTILHGLMLSGPYTIPAVKEDVYGVYTNTTPVEAYRGAGRPEATFMLERIIDRLADEIGVDPVEVRRRNLIPPFENGFDVITGLKYDSGNYPGALDKVLTHAGYARLREEQTAARKNGRYIGIGVSAYVEICGLGPSQVAGAVGSQGGLWESAIVRFHPSGKAHVFIGSSPHGQGEETTFAQIVADELGVSVNDVKVVHGDTETTPMGWGTYGSRTTAVSGAALAVATRKIKEKAKLLTSHLLEAAVEDIEYTDGKFFVRGFPDRHKTIQDIALMANVAWNMPQGMEPGLEATSFYDPPNFVYPFGAHLAVVEVDPETGHIALTRYVAVDDCGPQINPVIVEGQVHGGIVQGIGQALWEQAVYDERGQLLTGSLADYAIPRADVLPDIEVLHTVTPSPHHPLGVKGIGEAGTIASTCTVYNAVLDALEPFKVQSILMPLTPERVWRAIAEQKGGLTMYSADFDYHRARSLADAQRLLAAHPGAKLLAGGHSLIPLMKLRLAAPPAVIDIGRIPELRGISRTGGTIRIGALTTHAELAASAELQKSAVALAEAAALVGDPAVRSRGTIGGNVAHADPASDLPTALVALDARITAIGPKGTRTIPAENFFTGIMSTALADDEIVSEILVPASVAGQGSAYVKFAHPASRYAVIGAAALVSMTRDQCSAARVSVGGLLPHATRARGVETALVGKPSAAATIEAAATQLRADLGNQVSGDIYASAEYRAAVAPVYVKRAVTAAAARAGLA